MIRPGNHRVLRARPMKQELLQFFLSALVGVGRAISHVHVRHHVCPLLSCLLSSLILFLIVAGVNLEIGSTTFRKPAPLAGGAFEACSNEFCLCAAKRFALACLSPLDIL